MNPEVHHLSIAAVERDTGLGKDTLRVWERRYGFPQPVRDGNGERLYSASQVAKLRLVKRLMDKGLRPGKIFATPENEWETWLKSSAAIAADSPHSDEPASNGLIGMVGMLRSEELRRSLQHLLMKQGLERFVIDTIAPLNMAVGAAWMRGDIEVTDEHLYTELVQNILRSAISQRGESQQSPRILLTTFPDELHGLGLLMAEALLVSEGALCLSLGTQTPLADMVAAARKGDFDILALSFAATFPQRQAVEGLQTLSAQLAPATTIWAGGRGLSGISGRIQSIPGVRILGEISSVLDELHAWRETRRASDGQDPA